MEKNGEHLERSEPGEEARLLSLVDIFDGLEPREVPDFVRERASVAVRKGEVFSTPSDPPEKALFILKRGRVRVFRKGASGREFTLSVLDGGTVFGELDPTERRPRRSYAQAMEPSEVVPLSREDVERLILEKPRVGLRLVNLLFERLALHEQRLEDLGLKEVPARLANVLQELIESQGIRSGSVYKLPTHYTHRHLATMIGANREAVTRAFKVLREYGVVETHRRNIQVRDFDLLERAGEDGFLRESDGSAPSAVN